MTLVVIRGRHAAAPEPRTPTRNEGLYLRVGAVLRARRRTSGCARNSSFRSPGRYVSSAVFGRLFVSRRQVVGGAVGTTVSPATDNFSGTIFGASRSPFFHRALQLRQKTARGISNAFYSLSCLVFAHVEHTSTGEKVWRTQMKGTFYP